MMVRVNVVDGKLSFTAHIGHCFISSTFFFKHMNASLPTPSIEEPFTLPTVTALEEQYLLLKGHSINIY